jgi:hypothetical protein
MLSVATDNDTLLVGFADSDWSCKEMLNGNNGTAIKNIN